jgi:integral membrane protein
VGGAEPGLSAQRPVAVPASVLAALTRYRIIAYVVGVGLIVLVLIGVPLKYGAHVDGVVAVVGPLHGALYVGYLLLTLDLARRIRLSPLATLIVMAAGTIPFMSFVAERRITAIVMGPQRSTNPHVADTSS